MQRCKSMIALRLSVLSDTSTVDSLGKITVHFCECFVRHFTKQCQATFIWVFTLDMPLCYTQRHKYICQILTCNGGTLFHISLALINLSYLCISYIYILIWQSFEAYIRSFVVACAQTCEFWVHLIKRLNSNCSK